MIFACKLLAIITGSLCDARITASSEYVAMVVTLVLYTFEVYIKYDTGPNALPCITPEYIGKGSEY